jgi:hypothetical protein
MGLDGWVRTGLAPIPYVRELKLACGIGQAGIEYQAESEQEVALAHSVLTNQHRVAIQRDVEGAEIPQILDLDSAQIHRRLRASVFPIPTGRREDR